MIHPSLTAIGHGLITVPYRDPSYLYLVAANVGAVVMPWMIFYQQGAIVDKQLTVADLKQEQHDTAVGTFITQGIMILFVVVFAAATSRYHAVNGLQSVEDLAKVLSPFLGAFNARMLLSLSLLGGALVAALVVALAGTWGITEVLNWPHSLNEKLSRNNYGFYLIYILAHVIGAGLVLINFNLVALSVTVEVINALLLPIVLGFLLLLEAKALPLEYRMHGWYKWLVTICCLIVMAFGLYMVGPVVHLW